MEKESRQSCKGWQREERGEPSPLRNRTPAAPHTASPGPGTSNGARRPHLPWARQGWEVPSGWDGTARDSMGRSAGAQVSASRSGTRSQTGMKGPWCMAAWRRPSCLSLPGPGSGSWVPSAALPPGDAVLRWAAKPQQAPTFRTPGRPWQPDGRPWQSRAGHSPRPAQRSGAPSLTHRQRLGHTLLVGLRLAAALRKGPSLLLLLLPGHPGAAGGSLCHPGGHGKGSVGLPGGGRERRGCAQGLLRQPCALPPCPGTVLADTAEPRLRQRLATPRGVTGALSQRAPLSP